MLDGVQWNDNVVFHLNHYRDRKILQQILRKFVLKNARYKIIRQSFEADFLSLHLIYNGGSNLANKVTHFV